MKRWLVTLIIAAALAVCGAAHAGTAAGVSADGGPSQIKAGPGWPEQVGLHGIPGGASPQGAIWPDGIW